MCVHVETHADRDGEFSLAPGFVKFQFTSVADFLFILLKCMHFSGLIDVGDSGWLILYMQEIWWWKKRDSPRDGNFVFFYLAMNSIIFIFHWIHSNRMFLCFLPFAFSCSMIFVAWFRVSHCTQRRLYQHCRHTKCWCNSKLFQFQFQSQCIIIHVHGIAILMKWMVISILMSMSNRILWGKLQMQLDSDKRKEV